MLFKNVPKFAVPQDVAQRGAAATVVIAVSDREDEDEERAKNLTAHA